MNTAQAIVSAGFDISNITAPAAAGPATHKVDLVFSDDGDAVAGYIVVGKNSDQYRAASHAQRANGYQKAAKRKTTIDASTDAGSAQLVDLIDSNQQALAVAVVTGWYGFTSAGQDVPFNPAIVKASFEKFQTWQDKVLAALEVDSNFLKLSSPISLPTPSTSLSE